MSGNPQTRGIALRNLALLGLTNIILVVFLFFLNFKFWYIALIFSIFSILYFIVNTIETIKYKILDKFFYRLNCLWDKNNLRYSDRCKFNENSNQNRLNCIKKLDFYGILIISSIISLVILNFKFWYIALIISSLTIYILISLIRLTIKEFFNKGE